MKKIKKKSYGGMHATPIRGIGIRNNTKTYINGGRVKPSRNSK